MGVFTTGMVNVVSSLYLFVYDLISLCMCIVDDEMPECKY